MLEFKKYTNSDIDECTSLFLKVFSSEPWNDQWESFERAREYLLELVHNPVFIGYIVLEDFKMIGVCMGHKRSWWSEDCLVENKKRNFFKYMQSETK